MADPAVISAAARSIASLAPAVSGLDRMTTELEDIARASSRGYFTPDEDERVRARFAQYLTARAGLLQTITDLKPVALAPASSGDEEERLRAFTISYAAAALMVRAGRFIVEQYAPNKVVQRKLNEAEPKFGIPRKQYTAVYKSVTSAVNAWQLADAARFAKAHHQEIESLRSDADFAPVLEHLREAEPSIQRGTRDLVKARLRYQWHSWRRRRASAVQQALFGLFEMSGRVIAELRNPFHTKRVTPAVREQVARHLQPGDVMVSRHDDAASNLFLPGYWIHAALHIGSARDRELLGVECDEDRNRRWVDPIRVLEAKKDGVLFRPVDETLSVDAVAVIRPELGRAEITRAISQAVTHEGKLYDFEFDFFRSDRLVCTEVVYRGYHGVGGMNFNLTRRAGRPTLAAEDLLDMAVDRRGFEAVAVFGTPERPTEVVTGTDAGQVLKRSYRT